MLTLRISFSPYPFLDTWTVVSQFEVKKRSANHSFEKLGSSQTLERHQESRLWFIQQSYYGDKWSLLKPRHCAFKSYSQSIRKRLIPILTTSVPCMEVIQHYLYC